VFEIPDRHTIRVHYRKQNLGAIQNVEIGLVKLNSHLKRGSGGQGVLNNVNENSVELRLDQMYNAVVFAVHNADSMVFAVHPLQSRVSASPMGSVYPGAAAGNNSAFVNSVMNAPGHNMTLQQVNNHTDKTCKELVLKIRERMYKYYTDRKLTADQWRDIETMFY